MSASQVQVKCQEGVTYVEAQDCCKIAFVRCTDDAAAQSLVVKKIWSQSEILQGEEEGDYWKKIEENRIKKRDKSSRPKKSGAERARQKKESIIDADQPGYLPYQSYTTQKSAYLVQRRGR
ncbi:hypothetical protein DAPPUDRAFT_274413 [Daphnia pulex]|uniref:XRRM domain-containing protein n=1 Tax=Daphnia pulex TaxID=6669 RepID=E9I469_DAPPU|nr:hypothetical protein DAPPUDRAFT_274413 [Daphnia pulex]|eukprot:EFX61211.1 hypothetical protein DAPPUDRAFT_274413 [Daphnia pulex]